MTSSSWDPESHMKFVLDYIRRTNPSELLAVDVDDNANFLAYHFIHYNNKKKKKDKQTDCHIAMTAEELSSPMFENRSPRFKKAKDKMFLVREENLHANATRAKFCEATISNMIPHLIIHLDQHQGEKKFGPELKVGLDHILEAETEANRFWWINRLIQLGYIGKLTSMKNKSVDVTQLTTEAFVSRMMTFLNGQRLHVLVSEFDDLVVINVSQLLKTFVADRKVGKELRFWNSAGTQTDSNNSGEMIHQDPKFHPEMWIDGQKLLATTEDTLDEFSHINMETYESFKSCLYHKKKLRHSYSQTPKPLGHRTPESTSSPKFLFAEFERKKSCFFPLKSVGTAITTAVDKTKKIAIKRPPPKYVASVSPFIHYLLQYWRWIQQNPEQTSFNCIGWNRHCLNLLEYHYFGAKNPKLDPTMCSDHPQKKRKGCRHCIVAGLAPSPWRGNLSQTIYRLVRGLYPPRSCDFFATDGQFSSEKAVLLHLLRDAHSPIICADDNMPMQDCQCATVEQQFVTIAPTENHPKLSRKEYLHLVRSVCYRYSVPGVNVVGNIFAHLHTCPACGKEEKTPSSFHKCDACHKHKVRACVYYCSIGCAAHHWYEHKKFHEAVFELSHYDYEKERLYSANYAPLPFPSGWGKKSAD